MILQIGVAFFADCACHVQCLWPFRGCTPIQLPAAQRNR